MDNNQNTVMEQFELNFNKKKSPVKKIIGLVVLVTLCVVVFLFIRESSRAHIDLNDYLKISFSGYDGYGEVKVTFDGGVIGEEFAEELGIENYIELDNFDSYLSKYVEYEVDAPENLKNGDQVKIKWKVNEEKIEDKFNCRIEYKTETIVVSSLWEFTEYDPFEDMEVSYSGEAPYARVSIDTSNIKYDFLSWAFTFDKKFVRNGDVVTVTFEMTDDLKERCLNNGVTLTCTEKEYTVSGLVSYVEQISDIPEETMNSMKIQSEDVFNAYVASEWADPTALKGFEYIGSHLIVRKEQDTWYSSNRLYLVYEVTYNSGKEGEEEFKYYYYVSYPNLVILEDGTCSVDLSNYSESNDDWDDQDFSMYGLKFFGYQDLDSLFYDCVTANLDTYNYDTTVK